MADLRAICAKLGYRRVETYIASGNVVFECDLAAAEVQAQLESRLARHAGKPVDTFVRSHDEMRKVLLGNPFADREPKLTYALFLHGKPPRDAPDTARGRKEEEMRLGKREIYVYFPSGMGQSKLQIPAATLGTWRNLNTVAKLVEMSSKCRGEL